ncbi:zinc finger E-box-binding homeobox 1-like [Pseudochaenichthys georgianus]|uniref:zinc finger E-box-binding homeobox 1-like n=1 Tax=Pseudochaenichthys georgianus TaxID=52239 RepID=UPI00146AE842|nr:zinc finger E-box-binding homeobox 1-like [Pseudochaenichthys georgianus]
MEVFGAKRPKVHSISSCFLCDDCPDNLEALHLLQHYKAANGEAIDSAALDPSFTALLSGAGVVLEEPPVDDLLSLLKTYFASNANPSEKELTKISESVSFPVDVVRKWFAKMNSRKNMGKDVSNNNGHAEEDSSQEISNIASSADAPGSLHKHISSQGTTGPSSSQQEKILRGQTINPPQIGINVITSAQLRSLAVHHKSASCSVKKGKKRRLKKDPYPCELCYKVFKEVSSLLRHKYEH